MSAYGAECPGCGEPVIVGSAAQIAAETLREAAEEWRRRSRDRRYRRVDAAAWLRARADQVMTADD